MKQINTVCEEMQSFNARAGFVYNKHCAQRERLRVAKSLAHNIKQGPVGQAQLLNKCPMAYGSETFIHILFLIPPTNAHKCLLQ